MANKKIKLTELKNIANQMIVEEEGKYKYNVLTHHRDKVINKRTIYLDRPDFSTLDKDLPLTLGQHQSLVYLGED